MLYEIDFLTCSMDDVIERSIVCHPSLLIDSMVGVADIHDASAAHMYDATAKRIARQMADDCKNAALLIRDEGKGALSLFTFSQRIQVFHQAARAQCINRALEHEIAARAGA